MSKSDDYTVMCLLEDDRYSAENGYQLKREHGLTPNGNKMSGRWALRNDAGVLIDFDGFRSDLAERNNLKLI